MAPIYTHEILRLKAERCDTYDPVPERIALTLMYHVRPPVKADGEALLIRAGKFAGQVLGFHEIYYGGRLRGELLSSNFILWGDPFPVDGSLAWAMKGDENGLKSVLVGSGDVLIDLLSRHTTKEQRYVELNLVLKCAIERVGDDSGGSHPVTHFQLMGILDLSVVPEALVPPFTVYELHQRLIAKEPHNIG